MPPGAQAHHRRGQRRHRCSQQGAEAVHGGKRVDREGYFMEATVLNNVNKKMTVAREEIFGPVLSIIPFDTEEEAIAITNDTDSGLTNYVQTQDKEKAKRVAKQLRSGGVEMNGTGVSGGTPFGGFRQSGNGREGGKWGLEEYLEVKAISGWK